MVTESCKKVAKNFCCLHCDYNTERKSSYDKHILTPKHQKQALGDRIPKKVAKNTEQFVCIICNKNYCSRNGLWKHKKICMNNNQSLHDETNISLEQNQPEMKELIIGVINENNELRKIIQNMIPKIGNTHTNSHNKTFNLQFFLNEQCKDAMNIMDFVDSLQLQLTDLENVGKLGFVDGISNIIVKNLKALDIHKRPVHCSDAKREVLYVKDENKWEKENEEKDKLKKAIKNIADKNIRMITEWKHKYPDCVYSDSMKSDEYNHIIIESMGGSNNNTLISENKILKRISKEVIIEKLIDN